MRYSHGQVQLNSSFLLVSCNTFYDSVVTKKYMQSTILFSLNKTWSLFPSIVISLYTQFALYPLWGGKTVSCRILLDLYNLHCFLSLLVFSAVHQLDFHMNKCVWLPKGSCLLTSKGKKKRQKTEIFSELGPYKSIRETIL